MKFRLSAAAVAVAVTLVVAPATAMRPAASITLQPFRVSPAAAEQIRERWTDRMLATHAPGTWAPLKYDVTDEDLALLGLPSSDVLRSRRYPEPTMVTRDGRFIPVSLPMGSGKSGSKTGNGKGGGGSGGSGSGGGSSLGPTAATFAGAGWFGIRPGALLLLLTDGGIGWCSMAHVYGTPGAYKVSTAGHCGKVGDTASVIAAFGNHEGTLNPIVLDFGTFAVSHDNGLGDDYALIDVNQRWQGLVTPTMCVWGGPRGVYTKQGDAATLASGNGISPTVTPDPTLAQTVVHYGHGLGAHTLVTSAAASVFGGTPRAGEGISWRASQFMFNGYIAPGDSGSGANVIVGDSAGAGSTGMEAAGIITHIWIDPLMRDGIGLMGGTRVTKVGTPANGQLVPYPAPVTGLP